MGVTFKLIKKIGTVGQTAKGEKKLQFVSWNGEEPVYDLRLWMTGNKASSGVTFSKEDLLRIVELYKGVETTEEEVEEEDTEQSINDIFPINEPEEEEESAEEPKTVEKPKAKLVVTKTNYTYEDYINKLDTMFEPVIDQLNFELLAKKLKEAGKDNDVLIQNAMRESRILKDMMTYCKDKTYEELKDKNSQFAVVDGEKIVEYCIEYFNAEEEPKETPKPKAKATKNTKAKSTRGRKPSTKRKVTSVEEDDDIESLLNF